MDNKYVALIVCCFLILIVVVVALSQQQSSSSGDLVILSTSSGYNSAVKPDGNYKTFTLVWRGANATLTLSGAGGTTFLKVWNGRTFTETVYSIATTITWDGKSLTLYR